MSLPPVVPLRDALVVLAVLVVLAIASNLCLLAFLSTHTNLPCSGQGVRFTPRPLAGEGPGVRVPGAQEALP